MSKSKTKTTSQQVTKPTNPTWVEPAIQGLQTKIGSTFAGLDPQSLVAGPDALQTQAAQGASGLGMPSALGEAEGAFRGLGSARSIDGIGDYMSPYLKNVVDTSLADYDYGAGQTRAQDALARAGDTTFGGSGGSIQTALSNDALTRGRAGLSAGLYDQGFGRATSLASGDLNRRLQAASGLAGVGQAQGAEARANLGTQMDIGGILQQIAQAKAQAKVTALGQETALTAGLPYGLFQGQTSDGTGTSTTSPGLAGYLQAAGSLAGGLGSMGLKFSDARLKRDVSLIGTLANGLGLYAYRYLWSPVRHIGVMAHEVLKVKPEAVHVMPDGFMAVDYGTL